MNDHEETPGPRRDSPLMLWSVLLILATATLAYFALSPGGARTDDRGPNYPAVGAELSMLRFEPLTGDPPPVASDDLRGNVSVVNFWGPWCHFCRLEMPHLLELEEEFGANDDFRLVLVSYAGGGLGDVDQLREETEEYLHEIDTEQPTYHDPNAQSLRAMIPATGLANAGFPITVVLDRDGVLQGLWLGFVPEDADAMKQLVAKLLKSS